MPIPDYQSLMKPVLLKAANGEIGVRDVIERVGKDLGLTESERSQLLASGSKRNSSIDTTRPVASMNLSRGPRLPRACF
jgi:restriction endonuclease Mrr